MIRGLICFVFGHGKTFTQWVAYTELEYSKNEVDYVPTCYVKQAVILGEQVPAGHREHIYCLRCGKFLRFGKWER